MTSSKKATGFLYVKRRRFHIKIRTDFVTNSSSVSFILARLGELTDAQKEAFIKALAEDFIGKKALTPDSTEDEIKEFIEDQCCNENKEAAVRKALAQGKSIYVGCIDYEIAEDTINGLIKTLWEKLNEVEENKITIIDDDLDY